MTHLIGVAWLKAFGWKLEGETRLPRRFVFIAAPHTSNWDFPFMMATAWALRLRIRWLGKHTLFQGPFGWLFHALGGVPVDRRAPGGLVAQVIERFAAEADLMLAVPPEGTRGKVEYWKSGFYHIARGARVPVGLSFLDYSRRRCGLGCLVDLTDDVVADMDRIRAFYRDVRGRHPELECVPRIREEDEAHGRLAG